MSEQTTEQEPGETTAMHVREITLDDGRYMIFFTFGNEDQEADV